MGLRIQNKLIHWILQPLAGISNRFSNKARDCIFVCCGILLFLGNILYNNGILRPRYLYVFTFGCLMAGIMLFCTLPAKIYPIRFDVKLMIPWAGFTLFMLISGVTNSVDYLADTMLFVVMFPIFYLVWNNGAFSHVLQLFVWVCRITALLFFSISLIFFPIMGQQYTSCFENPNGFAFFLTALFCFLFLGVLTGGPKHPTFWVDLVLLGITYAFIQYSNSRTGQLAIMVSMVSTGIILLIIEKKQFFKTCVTHVGPVLLSLLLFFWATIYISCGIQRVVDPDNALTAEEIRGSIAGRQEVKNDLDRSFEQVSSRRNTIWAAYLKNIGFWGHSLEERFTYECRGQIVENGTAHMTILEYAYKFGTLSGVFLLAFNLIAGIKSIFYAVRKPKDRWTLMPLMMSLAFGVTSMVASVVSPFLYVITLFYFFVQTPLVIRVK